MNRKDFIKNLGLSTIGTLGGAAIGFNLKDHPFAIEGKLGAIPKRKLGKNGLMASVLCLGTGSRFTNENFLSAHERGDYLFYAFDRGVNYLDSAINYGPSEQILGELLTNNDWDKLILSTKTNSSTRRGIMENFKTSSNRLKREYFDVYLLHDSALATTIDGNAEAFETLLELREKGIVGNIGFSSHGSISRDLAIELVEKFELDHLVLSVGSNFENFKPIISDVRASGCTAAAIKIAMKYEGQWPEGNVKHSYKEVLEQQFTSGIISHSNEGIGDGGWKKVLDSNLDTARAFA